MSSSPVATISGSPDAYLEAQTHCHRYVHLTQGIERCSCGALRAAYPDEH